MLTRSWSRVLSLALAAGLVATGCAGSIPVPLPGRGDARDGDFLLTIRTPRTAYASDEPIQIETTLTYVGPLVGTDASGPAGGLVHFRLDHLDGPLDMEPAVDGACAAYRLARGEVRSVKFVKSGGFSADEPNAGFWGRYFRDPDLRLPPGRWRVTAIADFYTPAGCGEGVQHLLEASVEFTVS